MGGAAASPALLFRFLAEIKFLRASNFARKCCKIIFLFPFLFLFLFLFPFFLGGGFWVSRVFSRFLCFCWFSRGLGHLSFSRVHGNGVLMRVVLSSSGISQTQAPWRALLEICKQERTTNMKWFPGPIDQLTPDLLFRRVIRPPPQLGVLGLLEEAE